jgi:hypothetical protein
VKDAQPSLTEIFDSALEIDDRHRPRRVRRVKRTDQRIDAEVTTSNVLCQASGLYVWQRSGLAVGLMAKLRQIDLCIGRLDSNGAEPIVRNEFQILSGRFLQHGIRECAGVSLDNEIDIDELALEQQIAYRSSDEMDRRLACRRDLRDPREQCTGLIRHCCEDVVETEAPLH